MYCRGVKRSIQSFLKFERQLKLLCTHVGSAVAWTQPSAQMGQDGCSAREKVSKGCRERRRPDGRAVTILQRTRAKATERESTEFWITARSCLALDGVSIVGLSGVVSASALLAPCVAPRTRSVAGSHCAVSGNALFGAAGSGCAKGVVTRGRSATGDPSVFPGSGFAPSDGRKEEVRTKANCEDVATWGMEVFLLVPKAVRAT